MPAFSFPINTKFTDQSAASHIDQEAFMWIVALALRRPYTFVVVALLLLILGPIVIFRTPTDIFPNIDIPVVSILWNYAGLNAQDLSSRIVTLNERVLTTTVDDVVACSRLVLK